MNIDTLYIAELKTVYAKSVNSANTIGFFGKNRHAKFYANQAAAIMRKINDLDPLPEIIDDELLSAIKE
jgi:hypothetical protein